MTISMWIAFFINSNYSLHWNFYGIQPRTWSGLMGILFSPFLHANFGHLFHNSTAIFFTYSLVFYYFPTKSKDILLWIWFFSGLGVWLFGKFYSNHLGASGLVYGLVFFLIFSGFFIKNRNMWAMALLMIFLYGSLVWGLFPQIHPITGNRISWEGHLCGALTGFTLSVIFKKHGPKSDMEKYFEGEEEDEEDEEEISTTNEDLFEIDL
ncbi:MAG: rhomboid family intramembrane serine protease [Bacteroidota bacterium]|nr:rhomboid family intramembrane serine protease [Bacteroidota bacterium]